jgi:hypothetical protein
MKSKSLEGILLAILFSVAVVGWAAPAPKKHTAWQTYRSLDYGFTIAYPETMTFYPGHPVPPPENSMFPVCDDTIACFQYNGNALDGTPIQAAGVSVNVLRGVKTETDCISSIDTRSDPIKSIRIHGTLFHSSYLGEGGLGSSRGITEYLALYHHVCFDVAVVTAVSDFGDEGMKEEGFHPVNRRAWRRISSDMDRMLHSFTFVGPVKDGPDWDVYVDSGCGGSFEYPSSSTLQTVRDYSNDAFSSNRIACEQSFAYQGREYVVAVKVNVRDVNALDEWLFSSGYPGLEQVKILANGNEYAEYSNGTYTYIFSDGDVFIFIVSDASHHPIPSEGDRVFAHVLGSFRVNKG